MKSRSREGWQLGAATFGKTFTRHGSLDALFSEMSAVCREPQSRNHLQRLDWSNQNNKLIEKLPHCLSYAFSQLRIGTRKAARWPL